MTLTALQLRATGVALILAASLASCQATGTVDVKASVKPKTTAKASTDAKASARSLKFVASAKDGKAAKQPEPIEILVNGKKIELTNTKEAEIPADATGVVDVKFKNNKFATLNVKEGDSKESLQVVLLPWRNLQFIGEVLSTDFKDFGERLKKRANHFPLAHKEIMTANVKGVYIGKYRVPAHTYYVEDGDLFLDPSSEYYVRLSAQTAPDTVPPLRIAYADGSAIKGFKVTLKAYPKVLKPKSADAPPSPEPAPTVPDVGMKVDVGDISAQDAVSAATLDEFESKEVQVDDKPFPDPES